MIYAKVDPNTKEILQYPVDKDAVRKWIRTSGLSVPALDIEAIDLTPWGWYQVDYVRSPTVTTPGNKIVLDTPIWDGDRLVRTFKEVRRSDQETLVLWEKVRAQRNQLLGECDWVELPSVARQRSAEWSDEWSRYRTKLRNITEVADPDMIEWPNPPITR